jgi:methylmalonyl-CoA/ethylmalonyl-CoA epimerase
MLGVSVASTLMNSVQGGWQLSLVFDHIGIVASQIPDARHHISLMFAIKRWTEIFEDEVNGVSVQFGADGSGIVYELIAPLGERSPVSRAVKTGSAIINHVAYKVISIENEAIRLIDMGCVPIGDPKPAIAYGGQRIQFFMSPLNFVFELIEGIGHKHSFQELYS